MSADETAIRTLNEAYIQAFLASDVAWYDNNLAEDFIFIDGRGTPVDRSTFLQLTKAGTDVVEYRLDEVIVRFYGDVSLVGARGTFRRADGTGGQNRYTDVYARTNGEWRVVSAQVTPVAGDSLRPSPETAEAAGRIASRRA